MHPVLEPMTACLLVHHGEDEPYALADAQVCRFVGTIESVSARYWTADLDAVLDALGRPERVLIITRGGPGWGSRHVPLARVREHVRPPEPTPSPNLAPREPQQRRRR